MPTDRFSMTLGLTPGYDHANERSRGDHDAARVAGAWQRLSEVRWRARGILVTATIQCAVVAYPTARGCPAGGEHIVTIAGTRNPRHCNDAAAWRDAVLVLARQLKDEFKQTTAQVEFDAVDLVYLA